MRKGGKSKKRDGKNRKHRATDYAGITDDDMMDDEIDAFHKQREIVPLDVHEDIRVLDEDDEHPVFDFEDVNEEDEDDGDGDDNTEFTGLAAKITKQQKYLRAKIGGVDDEMHDDSENEEEKRVTWGRSKNNYYNADDYESNDEELSAEEEAEVLRLQKEKDKLFSIEDFGLEDISQDESDTEPAMEEMLVKGKTKSKASTDKEAQGDLGTTFEEVKKDLNALSREEQMDIVYSSAPELIGLLSELDDALEQLENKINPLLVKVREGKKCGKERMHYVEVKQLLLLAYCQAITFYLLLKSEGLPVRDHPVIARLVEIKNMLDKMKQLDGNLPSDIDEILNKQNGAETVVKMVRENGGLAADLLIQDLKTSPVSAETQAAAVARDEAAESNVDSLKDCGSVGDKCKRHNDQVGLQSKEMLKVRAALEEKLKQKGVLSTTALKNDGTQKHHQPVNRKLETVDDFDDDALDIERGKNVVNNGHASSLHLSKLSKLVNPQAKKLKVVSGDDDLPKRDDIGERRRKHELRVLAGAGITSIADFEDVPDTFKGDENDGVGGDDEMEEPEDNLYKQVEQKRASKLAAKAEMYLRTPAVPSVPKILVDGKRQITYQMEKNRGLTRARKKLTKNPRKKYKLKHQKAVVRRKGQVREIKRPAGPYGGELSGINAGISRSIRFKN